MNDINFSCPINPLSFGNVSYNMLRELYKENININLFPIGNDIDISTYDKADSEFKKWLHDSFNLRLKKLSKDSKSLKMWHLSGSESRVGKDQFLYTFYECDSPTEEELNLCKIQKATIFSSSHASECFKSNGCDNTHYIPIGFDEDFYETGKTYLENRVHFGLVGKFEKRKHTSKILKLWAEKYGDNPDYQLTCSINNPFFKEEQMKIAISKALDGKLYKNINFLPFLKTNSEMNELYNAIDINLGGMSGAEGWNLPAFNSTCLGKWSIVLNSTSHKDWANSENSILVEPTGKEDIYDGIFFNEGSGFNQGKLSTFTDEQFYDACDKAISLHGSRNKKGVELKEEFSYNKTILKIIKIINEHS